MVGKVLIELRSHLSHLGKVVPRAGWKVMMLNVITYVHVRDVPPADIVI